MKPSDVQAGRLVLARLDPMYPATAVFALGRPFGLVDAPDDHTAPDAVPFGFRQAVVAAMEPVGGLSAYGFDHERQIGTIVDSDGTVLPLLRHTTGQTRTTTNPDGHRGPDTDVDQRED